MDKETGIALIFKKITYANIIRYLLTAVMLNKSYEYYKGDLTTKLDFSGGLFFFIAAGIVFYWIYRPTYYDKIFMKILDFMVFSWNKIFPKTSVDNYRRYFNEVEKIKKKHCMTVYYSLKKELTSKYYDNNINLKASSIHFFAMSSFAFFCFSFKSLGFSIMDFSVTAGNNIIFTEKSKWFLLFGLLSLIFALLIDIDLEKMELDNIKEYKKNNKKKYAKFMKKQQKSYGR